MKKNLSLLLTALCLITVPFTPALTCTPSQERVTYNSLWTAEQATTGALNAYFDLVISGQAPTNGLPVVKAAYDDFQMALYLAVSASPAGTNGPVTALVSTKQTAVITAISRAKGK